MKKIKSNEIIPLGVNIAVEIKIKEKEINGVSLGKSLANKSNIEFYSGKVLKLGESSTDGKLGQCPNLEEGDFVIFSQFAGVVPPTEDIYMKVVTGHDIVAYSKNEDMNIEDIMPANERILVKILEEDIEINGVKIKGGQDPRELQVQKCEIIRLGLNSPFKENDIVFIEPDCGNLIVNDPDLKLKTVEYRDILFKI